MVAKMRQREFIILCLEDSGDWSNATTRRVVMKVRGVNDRVSRVMGLFSYLEVSGNWNNAATRWLVMQVNRFHIFQISSSLFLFPAQPLSKRQRLSILCIPVHCSFFACSPEFLIHCPNIAYCPLVRA